MTKGERLILKALCEQTALLQNLVPNTTPDEGLTRVGFPAVLQSTGKQVYVEAVSNADGTFSNYRIHSVTGVTDQLTMAGLDFYQDNQVEGLTLNPYCDPTTGDITGYESIVVDENNNQIQVLYLDGFGGEP